MRRKIIWAVTNTGTIACAVAGIAFVQPWAVNVFKFLAWFGVVVSLLVFCSKEARREVQKKGPSVPIGWTIGVDFLLAVFLAAYGWFGYATLVMLTSAFQGNVYLAKEEK